jgi:hypothetical protein
MRDPEKAKTILETYNKKNKTDLISSFFNHKS